MNVSFIYCIQAHLKFSGPNYSVRPMLSSVENSGTRYSNYRDYFIPDGKYYKRRQDMIHMKQCVHNSFGMRTYHTVSVS